MWKGKQDVALTIVFCPALNERPGQRPIPFGEKVPTSSKVGHTYDIDALHRLGEPEHFVSVEGCYGEPPLLGKAPDPPAMKGERTRGTGAVITKAFKRQCCEVGSG